MAVIIGTEGDDRDDDALVGTFEGDLIRGLGGDDHIDGLGGDDFLEGGPGRDSLRGGPGDDTILSGDGNDFIEGGEGDDRIDASGMVLGSGGFLQPGLGADSITGSLTLWERNEGLDLGWSDVEGAGGLTISIVEGGSGTARSGNGRVDDSFTFANVFVGSRDADRLTSFDEAEGTFRFEGWIGSAGDDTIDGGTGGFDSLVYTFERREDEDFEGVTVDFSTGTAIDTFGDTDTFTNIEAAEGTSRADRFIGSSAGSETDFFGLAGDDVFEGAPAGEGPDGEPFGLDRVNYYLDAFRGGDAGVVVDLAEGFARDGFGDTDRLSNIDRIVGTRTDDEIFGNERANRLDAREGDDLLEGRGGNDALLGDEGDDRLDGGAGSDTLFGGEGSDTLIGGGAIDEASGGDDADFFALFANGAPAGLRIMDFSGSGGDGDVLVIDDRYLGLGRAGFDLRALSVEEAFGLLDDGTASLGGGLLTFDADGDGAPNAGAQIGAAIGVADVLIF